MGLWLLSFTGGGIAVIMKAESLSHARLLTAAHGFCRASLFDEGYAIDPDLTTRIPKDLIGRKLSRDEAANILKTLIFQLFSPRHAGPEFWQPVRPPHSTRPLYPSEGMYLEAVASAPQYCPDREYHRSQSAIAADVIRAPHPIPVDDLSAPLGSSRKPDAVRRPIFAYLATAGLFGMAIAGFAVWCAAPVTRPPIAPPAPHQAAAVFPPDPPSELRPRDTAPSGHTDTSVLADLVTVQKARGYASNTNADTLQADPDGRIITIVDGRDGSRRHIRVPATGAPVSR
jgi:hypothetical protein